MTASTARALFSGSGPGPRTSDGCSVALYRQVPYLDELEACGLPLARGAQVLELGCGTGRLTGRMLAAGVGVTAVDNSDDMLRSVPDGAVKVLADIESLDVGRTFDSVLLASGLINHPQADTRQAFVDCARRHLPVGGRFVLQRQDPDWLRDVAVGASGTMAGMTMHVEAVDRSVVPMTMTLRYEFGADVWRQSFAVVGLSEPEVESLLSAAGFDAFAWHGPKRRWLSAIATPIARADR